MIDFSKLATVLIRLGALYAICIGAMTLAFSITAYFQGGTAAMGPDPTERVLVSVLYFVGASLLLLFSRSIGRLMSRGL
jgi:hypothetical protein